MVDMGGFLRSNIETVRGCFVMSRNVKKIICLLMSLLLLFPLNILASAATVPGENEIQPRLDYTNVAYVSLAISSSGTATCSADAEGYDGITTKVHIKMTLQKYTILWWSKVETWEGTFNDTFGILTRTAQVGSGTYRVKAEFTVYSGSNSEEITSYSQEKKFTKS